jgi:hypothetical protein
MFGIGKMLFRRPSETCPSGLWWTLAIAALVVVFAAQAALAGEGCLRCKGADPCRAGLMLCCPDDYCRKPMPCVPCPCNTWCPDDYCRKPMPCVPCLNTTWCADDYCRKPMPCVCYPASPVKYSCGSCPAQQ